MLHSFQVMINDALIQAEQSQKIGQKFVPLHNLASQVLAVCGHCERRWRMTESNQSGSLGRQPPVAWVDVELTDAAAGGVGLAAERGVAAA